MPRCEHLSRKLRGDLSIQISHYVGLISLEGNRTKVFAVHIRDVRREAGRDCWDGFRNPLYGRQFPPNSCGARPIAATPTESIAVALPFQHPGRRWRSSSPIPVSTFRTSPGTRDQSVPDCCINRGTLLDQPRDQRSTCTLGHRCWERQPVGNASRPSLRDGTTRRPKPLGAAV